MNSLDLLKPAIDLAKFANNAELYEKLLRAYEAMNEHLRREGELELELRRARTTIADLETKLCEVGTVEYHREVYWQKRPDGALAGPMSPLAWDRDRKLIRLVFVMSRRTLHGTFFEYRCPVSENEFLVSTDFLQSVRALTDEEILQWERLCSR